MRSLLWPHPACHNTPAWPLSSFSVPRVKLSPGEARLWWTLGSTGVPSPGDFLTCPARTVSSPHPNHHRKPPGYPSAVLLPRPSPEASLARVCPPRARWALGGESGRVSAWPHSLSRPKRPGSGSPRGGTTPPPGPGGRAGSVAMGTCSGAPPAQLKQRPQRSPPPRCRRPQPAAGPASSPPLAEAPATPHKTPRASAGPGNAPHGGDSREGADPGGSGRGQRRPHPITARPTPAPRRETEAGDGSGLGRGRARLAGASGTRLTPRAGFAGRLHSPGTALTRFILIWLQHLKIRRFHIKTRALVCLEEVEGRATQSPIAHFPGRRQHPHPTRCSPDREGQGTSITGATLSPNTCHF